MASATRSTYCLWVTNALKALGRGSPQQVYRWIRANKLVPTTDTKSSKDKPMSPLAHSD